GGWPGGPPPRPGAAGGAPPAAAAAPAAAAPAARVAAPAAAGPATTVSYPAWASATRYSGLAFDTCTAPPLAAMRAWATSPYNAIGVHVGGQNRTRSQPPLTPRRVRAVPVRRSRPRPR